MGFLAANWDLPGLIVIVYELNGPIRFVREADADKVRDAWLQWRSGFDSNELAIQRMLAKGKTAPMMDQVVETYDEACARRSTTPRSPSSCCARCASARAPCTRASACCRRTCSSSSRARTCCCRTRRSPACPTWTASV